MFILRCLAISLAAGFVFSAGGLAQNATGASVKPTEHLLGTVTALDSAARTITVKEDKTGSEQTVLLTGTKTLLKVTPGAKDLKSASRITAEDLAVGDRVDVRGFKAADAPNTISARSVVLMSARDLQEAHQAQAAEWRHSIAGVVTSLDAAAGKLTLNSRTPSGPQTVVLQTSPTTEFLRYSPEMPDTPAPSQFAQIQAGDQVRVIGEKSADGSAITAQKIYSSAFRTINGTVASLDVAGRKLTIKDLSSKKPVDVLLNPQSSIRKIPPTMAMALARRLNPGFKPAASSSGGVPPSGGSPAGAPPYGAKTGEQRPGNGAGNTDSSGAGQMGIRSAGKGDVSQMIESLPKIDLSELKPGDAVVVSGVAGKESGQLIATAITAGVEPILQSAPPRQGGRALGGDWDLGEINAPE